MKEESKYVILPQKSGKSKWYKHPGHGYGNFDFSKPPEYDSELGINRYLFINEKGDSWYLPLERKYQGSRWEKSPHAKSDYLRYLKSSEKPFDWTVAVDTLQAMWGDSQIKDIILKSIATKSPWDELIERLYKEDTWRSISAGEPKP